MHVGRVLGRWAWLLVGDSSSTRLLFRWAHVMVRRNLRLKTLEADAACFGSTRSWFGDRNAAASPPSQIAHT